MRSFYIATGLERGEEAKALAAQLQGLGLSLSYAWWEHGSVQSEGPERIQEVAIAEANGVRSADLFVCLLPGGRGTHTELGMAIATSLEQTPHGYGRHEKTILLVGPTEQDGRTCAFYLHPHVDERFATIGELLAWLKAWRRCNPLPTAASERA